MTAARARAGSPFNKCLTGSTNYTSSQGIKYVVIFPYLTHRNHLSTSIPKTNPIHSLHRTGHLNSHRTCPSSPRTLRPLTRA